MLVVNSSTQLSETIDMHIEPTRANVVSTRHCDIGRTTSGNERTQHTNRGAHFAN